MKRRNPANVFHLSLQPSEAGLGLIEILISLVLSMLLAIALFTVLHSTLFGAISQRSISALQESERRAAANIQEVAHAGGYFVVDPSAYSAQGSIPISALQVTNALTAGTVSSAPGTNVTYANGQYVVGTSNPDVLNIRFQSALNANGNANEPPTMDCLGQAANSTTPTIYNNTYFVDTTNHSLDCAVNGGTPQIIVGNGSNGGIQVESMTVLYGVDTNSNGSVTEYQNGNQVTDWSSVLTAQITLNYANPLYVTSETLAQNKGQLPTIPFTFLVDFKGAGNVN